MRTTYSHATDRRPAIAAIITPLVGIVICLIGIALTTRQSRKPARDQRFWPAGVTVAGMWVCVVGLALGSPAGVWLALTVVMAVIAAMVSVYTLRQYRIHRHGAAAGGPTRQSRG